MARPNRFETIYDDCLVHVRLQVNNGEFRFNKVEIYRLWRRWTRVYLNKYPTVKITGYQWMSNHCHLIMHTEKALDLTKFLHDINWRFALEYNKLHKRKGHFFQSRYRCTVIEENEYELACQRYIYRNPIRARMVKSVMQNKWGSYHYYASGQKNELITPTLNYQTFGNSSEERCRTFKIYVESLTPYEEGLLKKQLRHPKLA